MPGNPGSGGGYWSGGRNSQTITPWNEPTRKKPPTQWAPKPANPLDATWSDVKVQVPPRSPIRGLPPTGFVPQREDGGPQRPPYLPVGAGGANAAGQGDQYRSALSGLMSYLNSLQMMR